MLHPIFKGIIMADPSITDVNNALAALVATPQVDYRIGDKEVRSGQKFSQLLALRKQLIESPAADIRLISFDASDINEFGTNDNQMVL